MSLAYELWIGLRYTRAKRRNHFISFISLISMGGVALGVAALIVVLSVMNGFQQELRTRILGVASHVQISGVGNELVGWEAVAEQAGRHPRVLATAPYVQGQGMLSLEQVVRGVQVRGIVPEREEAVAGFRGFMQRGRWEDLQPGGFGIVLGNDLANALGARLGDKVALIVPQGAVTIAGVAPRLRAFTVTGIFEVGMYEYDSGLALIHLEDAQRLYRLGDAVSGVRLKLDDLFAAPRVSRELLRGLDEHLFVSDWTRAHANFFRAVQIEKNMMFIILSLIVAVAAFNIVSTMVMAVTDKQADIAILRTLGATPRSILAIFMVQGTVIGVVGMLLGVALGLALAFNIDVVVPAIERALGFQFLAKDVYYISELPSQVLWSDVFTVAGVAFALALLATIYPSISASRVNPAEALRYE